MFVAILDIALSIQEIVHRYEDAARWRSDEILCPMHVTANMTLAR